MKIDLSPYIRIFILSVLMLASELFLIRWISTEIRIFAYFKNLTLISCFLGMGAGCLLVSRRAVPLFWMYPVVLALCAAVEAPLFFENDIFNRISAHLGSFNEMAMWAGEPEGSRLAWNYIGLAILLFFFFLVALVFIPQGWLLGRLLLDCGNKIAGYSCNVGGSLIGILCSSVVAWFGWPPWAWFLFFLLTGIVLLERRREVIVGVVCTGLTVTVLLLPLRGTEARVYWSPYQKLICNPLFAKGSDVQTGYQLEVNNTFYQRAVNLDPAFMASHIEMFPGSGRHMYLSYNLLYRLHPAPREVLVVGAGMGNDVAAALRNGAQHVDAVEIDPVIGRLGRALHPEKPYSDPRVTLIVDDARNYMQRAGKSYDMIAFGALDSHTINSSLSNIRIDNYVYTVEAFREARRLLADDGLLCVTFSVERPFIGERLYAMIKEAFGRPPVAFNNSAVVGLEGAGEGPTFVITKDESLPDRIKLDPDVRSIIATQELEYTGNANPGTDDWPYLYLEKRSIPRLYYIVTLLILLLGIVLIRPVIGSWKEMDPHFFLLGAGFLLLEVQGVTKLSLLFGTTWMVNSVVFGSILVMVLFANLLAARLRGVSKRVLYVCLFISLIFNFAFPFRLFLSLEPVARTILASAFFGLPVFFASLIFCLTFEVEKNSHSALGANLLGAIAGGLCESVSFVTGVNALGLLALAFYAGSFASLRLTRRL